MMISLFDLREQNDQQLIEQIQNLYEQPLNIIRLANSDIKACIGCWSCWLKTPGRCVLQDDLANNYQYYVNSSTVILVMDVAQGFINHRAKAFWDRTIPHYHPHIGLVGGECHHLARYQSYPDMVFYYDDSGLTGEQAQVIEDYLYRSAYHFKAKASYRIMLTKASDDSNDSDKSNSAQLVTSNQAQLSLKHLQPRTAKNKLLAFAKTDTIDKLVIYNGSPRRHSSNSGIILNAVVQALGEKVEIRDLKQEDKWQAWSSQFAKEENVMIIMPLYVHAMPSHVMKFIELLPPSTGNISFFVQSGFPESSQSYYLEAYLEQLAQILGREYLGTVIKAGVEGLQARPVQAQANMIKPLQEIITKMVLTGSLPLEDIKKLAHPERFNLIVRILFSLFGKKLLNKMFWDKQLIANGALCSSYDRPYEKK